jgi:single-strand DNA-binding protein
MANFNINKVVLGGRLTSDVELKQTPSGVSVCSFSIAINRKYAKEGEQQADFINCQAWRGTAEFISKYFRKGSSICITGSIHTRSWNDQNGNKRYATEVVADEAMFVDSKGSEDAPNAQNGSQSKFEPSPYIPDAYTQPSFEQVDTDDSLPF